MQYEQVTPGERRNLPRPSIDTGMGLERIAAVLQGKHDNYDIDLLRALVLASAEASKVAADGPQAVSHRVIADHLRASSFLIADGVLPSKEGRGYVLRRIMRRAMRHAHILGCKDPLMWRLVPALVRQMGAAYPELVRAAAADHRDAEARGDQLQANARARPEAARRGGREARPRRGLLGRSRLQALRHVRLPARPDRGRAARARAARSRSRPSTRRWSGSARTRARAGSARARRRPSGSGSSCARSSAPPSSSATRPMSPRARSWRSWSTARRSRPRWPAPKRRSSSTRRRSTANRAARWATPARCSRAGGGEFAVRDTQKKAGDLFVHLGTVTQRRA